MRDNFRVRHDWEEADIGQRNLLLPKLFFSHLLVRRVLQVPSHVSTFDA